MYSYKQKIKAVKFYFNNGESLAYTINSLGYPHVNSLRDWIEEYKRDGTLTKKYHRPTKFTKKEINEALKYFRNHGHSIGRTIKALGYPCDETLREWLNKYEPSYKPKTKKSSISINSKVNKEKAIKELCTSPLPADDIAKDYNVTRTAVYNWKNKSIGKGNQHSMAKKNLTKKKMSNNKEELTKQVKDLKNQVEELSNDIFKLKMEKDILEKAAELIKKDNGISID